MSNQKIDVMLTINNKQVKARVLPEQRMADFLHENLGLTGTKVCCGIGVCKACTFACKDTESSKLRKMQACITPMSAIQGAQVTTIEGLAQDEKHLSPLQQAFLKHFSFQCGYCTSGFLMAATVLLDELKTAPIGMSEVNEAIDRAVGENICRCTGYVKYHTAIRSVILATPGLVSDGPA